jgi:hypothetical protein
MHDITLVQLTGEHYTFTSGQKLGLPSFVTAPPTPDLRRDGSRRDEMGYS